jgi:Bacteriophage HK97-gp10, putative tail-component
MNWTGLDAFKAALKQLPTDLRNDARSIVLDAAHGAADDIRQAYPVVTGDLREGVEVVTTDVSQFGVGAVVINRAKHANIFEHGSQVRHTKGGANRGAMPPGHVFIPRIIRARKAMYERLKDLLTRAGLEVSGDA